MKQGRSSELGPDAGISALELEIEGNSELDVRGDSEARAAFEGGCSAKNGCA